MARAIVLVIGVVCLMGCAAGSGSEVSRLRCESVESPINVGTARPRLSWVPARDAQTAYQVLAATTPRLLGAGKTDLWDSGRVESDQSIQVEYGGKELRSGQRVYWTVRVWDREGRASGFARAAEFTTALLTAAEWQGKWITGPTGGIEDEKPALEGTKWVWYPEAGFAENTRMSPGRVSRVLRRSFAVPAGARLDRAVLHLAADNESETYVNGVSVGKTEGWHNIAELNVGAQLKTEGENVILIRASNGGTDANPAGVIGRLVIPVTGGEAFAIATDESWEAAEGPDGPWEKAAIVADYGQAPWNAIASLEPHPPLPIFRKQFAVGKKLERALIHVSGLGHYKLHLNGKPVGENFMDPAWSNYEKTVYYNTFDVTDEIRKGENALGVMLGRSYYSTKGDRRLHGKLFDRPPVVIAQLDLRYEDGSVGRVVTDGSWHFVAGPYVHDSLLGGVTYDARRLPAKWDTTDFNDSYWTGAVEIDPKLGAMKAQPSPSLATYEEFEPVSVNEPAPGRYVYAFAQNASATVKLKVSGKAGAVVRLTYAEQREGQSPHKNDGRGLVDQSGIRSPNYIEYVCKGEGDETWFCDLFYSGFQYMELTGAVPARSANPEGKPVVSEIKSVHVRSSAPVVGTFRCSNDMINRIERMTEWSVKSNLSHVLTDCPHREKMGWLEVPHLMWDSMVGRYDLSTFGPKVCEDMRDAQRADGMIPTVAPAYGEFPGPFQYTPEWGAAGVLIPWFVYQTYGDERVLKESYGMMRGYVDYMRSTCKEGLVPAAGLGDWYDYVPGKDPGPSKLTPTELSAMAIFYQCTTTLAETGKLLGRAEEAAKYEGLAVDIRRDFNTRFYQGNGVYKNTGSCQTANAMALVTGLAPQDERAAIVKALVEDLKRYKYQQTSGDVGFHYLVRALADNGQADALYRILDRKDLGSYAFLVNGGWTSLPEAWDAHHHSSMNHCMLGHIQEFFTRNVAGIQPLAPAYKRILITPTPHETVKSAEGTLESPYGRIESSWRVEGNVFRLTVEIPPNTSGRVEMPDGSAAREVGPGKHVLTATLGR